MECKLCANNSEHGPGFCCFLGCGPGVGASGAFEGTPGAGHIEYRAWANAAAGEKWWWLQCCFCMGSGARR